MSARSVGVVDYGSGNLRSVSKALEAAGARTGLISKPAELEAVDAVVVPGVGAFGDCASNLRATGLWDPLKEWIGVGRPYLGICLGYQLLFESSEESPGVAGLGVIPGRVVRFSGDGLNPDQAIPHAEAQSPQEKTVCGLKVPHMGWNTLTGLRGPLYRGLPEGVSVYFVHSFYPVPEEASLVSATCEYGVRFAAGISRGALHATQFHPEKSQAAGLAILRNFLSTL